MQPAGIPSLRAPWSCDKRLPLDTWNLSGPQENVFGIPRFMFDSSQTPYHGILHSATSSATGALPVHGRKRWRTNWEHNYNADVCRKAVDKELLYTGGYSAEIYSWTAKTADIGTAIQQFHPSTFSCWKIRFKNQVNTCSNFPSEAMLWIEEVEMVDAVD